MLGSHDNVYGPGGQGVYEDPEVGTVLYYHYVDTNVGYVASAPREPGSSADDGVAGMRMGISSSASMSLTGA